MWLKIVAVILFFGSLIGCSATGGREAPVSDLWNQPQSTQRLHVAQVGDTLYSIAWRYGKDYRDLAHYNAILPPYRVHAGQRIWLVPTGKKTTLPRETKVVNTPVTNLASAPDDIPAVDLEPHVAAPTAWSWPALGKVIAQYVNSNGGNKGLDIAGQMGDPVRATAAGKVVYAGNGLRGYGELLIVKHNEEFLSAYAHNRKLLVHEGQSVKAGQVIAEMGDTEAQQVMVHFEIRQAGKPVDPMQYLPKR